LLRLTSHLRVGSFFVSRGVDLVHMPTHFRCSRVPVTDRSENGNRQLSIHFWLFSVRFESP
jgi:hypothetical protein